MRVAMLLHKSVLHDSRVRREASALAEDGHDVTLLELAPVAAESQILDGFRRRSVLPAAWVRRLLPPEFYRLVFAWTFVRGLLEVRPEVIHAHDAAMLLPGLIGRRLTRAALVYDSHELATGVPYRDKRWECFVRATEAAAMPRCAEVITVSDGIAQRLRSTYRLERPPRVVRNVPATPGGQPRQRCRLRHAVGLDSEPLVLHQGSAAPGRGTEVLVRAMTDVPGAHLAFLGAAVAEREELTASARRNRVEDRVHALPPVPVDELLDWTAEADVGVSLLEDSCDNHRLALPNKVFEYVAAGVPVVVSDLPELRRLVDGEGVGWATDGADPRAVATALRTAIEARGDRDLQQRLSAAGRELRWDVEKKRLLDVYRSLAHRPSVRLRRTYSGYRRCEAKQRAWAADNPGNQAIRRELLARVLGHAGERLEAGAQVLDVGCGTGWLLRALAANGVDLSRLTGVDELHDRVERARLAVPGARVLCEDAARLPFPDASFDVVTLMTVLSSIPETGRRAAVLRECARLLRAGGLLLLYEPRLPNPLNRATGTVLKRDVRAAGMQIVVCETLTIAPPLARRLGAWTPSMYYQLARLPALRSHRLIVATVTRPHVQTPAPR